VLGPGRKAVGAHVALPQRVDDLKADSEALARRAMRGTKWPASSELGKAEHPWPSLQLGAGRKRGRPKLGTWVGIEFRPNPKLGTWVGIEFRPNPKLGTWVGIEFRPNPKLGAWVEVRFRPGPSSELGLRSVAAASRGTTVASSSSANVQKTNSPAPLPRAPISRHTVGKRGIGVSRSPASARANVSASRAARG
jgi:hypothetical protein